MTWVRSGTAYSNVRLPFVNVGFGWWSEAFGHKDFVLQAHAID